MRIPCWRLSVCERFSIRKDVVVRLSFRGEGSLVLLCHTVGWKSGLSSCWSHPLPRESDVEIPTALTSTVVDGQSTEAELTPPDPTPTDTRVTVQDVVQPAPSQPLRRSTRARALPDYLGHWTLTGLPNLIGEGCNDCKRLCNLMFSVILLFSIGWLFCL